MFHPQPRRVKGIIPTNHGELRKHELVAYHKTRDFKKKIAQLYVPALLNHSEEANGRFPVFKVSKNAFDSLLKKSNAGTQSSTNLRKKHVKPTTNHVAIAAQRHLQNGPRKNVMPAKANSGSSNNNTTQAAAKPKRNDSQ